ncbi:MAG: hypothetical protein ABI806_13405 [Candidatus Solibacter sp.]
MNSDFEDLLNIFIAREVRYLIVGGHAVMLYTEPRYTKDLDIWIDASEQNAERVFQALLAFGAPLAGLKAADFANEGWFYQMGIPPVRVDILMSIDGVAFDEAWQNRRASKLGKVDAWFIGRADLIRNKRTVGRHIDLHDADSLEKEV